MPKFKVPKEGDVDRDRRLLAILASRIKNNKHLRKILSDAKPEFRQALYHEFEPHLTFDPKPFADLKLDVPPPANA